MWFQIGGISESSATMFTHVFIIKPPMNFSYMRQKVSFGVRLEITFLTFEVFFLFISMSVHLVIIEITNSLKDKKSLSKFFILDRVTYASNNLKLGSKWKLITQVSNRGTCSLNYFETFFPPCPLLLKTVCSMFCQIILKRLSEIWLFQ